MNRRHPLRALALLMALGGCATTQQTGQVYDPIETETVFGFDFGEVLEAGDEVPLDDTAAASGPIQGQVLVFLVDQGVSENRPLELEIDADGDKGVVELDI